MNPIFLFLTWLLTSTVIYSSPSSQIILMNGKLEVKTGRNFDFFETWNACLSVCYQDEDCVVIHQFAPSECRLYRFGAVSSVHKFYGGDVIGVKTSQPSLPCPAAPIPIVSISPFIRNNATYLTKASNLNDTWNFTYSVIKCWNNTKFFIRGEIGVCIGISLFPNISVPGNYYNASALCRESENGVSLTGPASKEEASWLNAAFKNASKHISGSPTMWLDGISLNKTRVFVMEDDTHFGTAHYPFYTNEPNSGGLLICMYMPLYNGYVDDNWCNNIKLYGGTPRGAACRFHPEVEQYF